MFTTVQRVRDYRNNAKLSKNHRETSCSFFEYSYFYLRNSHTTSLRLPVSMALLTRKRRALLGVLEDGKTDDQDAALNDHNYDIAYGKMYKCPWRGCGKLSESAFNFRIHYRTHSQAKPYSCTFPGCATSQGLQAQYSQTSHVISHIIRKHPVSSKLEAKQKYMKVDQGLIDKETKRLGISSTQRRGTPMGEDAARAAEAPAAAASALAEEEEKEEEDGTELTEKLVLQHFTSIYRNSITGHYSCPFPNCSHELPEVSLLKRHYRTHLSDHFRPYQCVYDPASCCYSAKHRSNLNSHLRLVHLNSVQVGQLGTYIHTRTDLLKMEDALFASAKIISSCGGPDIGERTKARISRYGCPVEGCAKQFPTLAETCRHYRVHTGSQPFWCLYPGCGKPSTQRNHALLHVLGVHFEVPLKEQKWLSAERKEEATAYVGVLEEVLAQEEAEVLQALGMEEEDPFWSPPSSPSLPSLPSPPPSKRQKLLNGQHCPSAADDDDSSSTSSSGKNTYENEESSHDTVSAGSGEQQLPDSEHSLCEIISQNEGCSVQFESVSDSEVSSFGNDTESGSLLDGYDPCEDEIEDDSDNVAYVLGCAIYA